MKLSPRHVDVLRLYALGMTRRQIGEELIISPITVMNHLAQAREILGARNSVHAVTICIARGHLCIDGRDGSAKVYAPRPLEDLVDA
jgi:DNA-binding CsgD family transcriptional regulator